MMGLLAVVAAYLIGGIPFGLIVVKLMTGADVRESGSGNIGATNVLRTTGLAAGVLTLVLDAAKAWLAVFLADRLSGGNELWMSAAALAVLVGHAWSLWIRFKGGKAVASTVPQRTFIPLRFRWSPSCSCSYSWWRLDATFPALSAQQSRRVCFRSPAG